MGINKVVYGNTTLIDLTDSTLASADQLSQGITAYDRTGTKITGTATGGAGAVIQDEDGGLHFLEDGVNAFSDAVTELANGGFLHTITGVMASGGLEYEEGTWSPSEDMIMSNITFSNSHSVAPYYFVIADASGDYDSTNSTSCFVMYVCFSQLSGESMYPSDSSVETGRVFYTYRAQNSSAFSYSVLAMTHTYDEQGDTQYYPNWWVTSSVITARTSSTAYWRANRTYKWMAVWAPTT